MNKLNNLGNKSDERLAKETHCLAGYMQSFTQERAFTSKWVYMFTFFTFLSVISAFAQNIKISGVVIDSETEEGLPGVTVMVQNSSNGTITDLDGNYSLSVDENAVLLFSFVGYQTLTVPVSGKTKIDVVLEIDMQSLDEVVVVGYGEQKKANLTGAITAVDPKIVEDIPVGNLGLALIGKMAGVQVNRNGTGIPGTSSPLVIRDESASGTVRQVLYVIDGFIYTQEQDGTGPSGHDVFNRLDPSEIESISILKDAAAAVYGARGAGGVVIVKTKRGAIGKPKVSYSGSMGFNQPTRVPEMLSAEEHALMMNEIFKYTRGNTFDDAELAAIKGRDYNWVDGLYKTGTTNRHAFNVSGGTESVRYFLGSSYYKETGNFDNLYYNKFGIRSNLEADLSKSLVFALNMNYSQGKNQKPYYSSDSQPGVLRDWYGRLLTAPRWLPPTIDGYPTQIDGSWNPYALMDSENYSGGSSDNFNIGGKLEYKVPMIDGLKLNAQYSYNINTDFNNRFAQNYNVYKPIYEGNVPTDVIDFTKYSVVSNKEGIVEGVNRGKNYQINTTLNYNKSFDKHNINALLVYEQTEGSSFGYGIQKYGADILGINQLWAFSNDGMIVEGDAKETGRYGLVGRLNYDFNGKYLIESSFRHEASSKFAPEFSKGFFPAVSMGWVLSEESFLKNNVKAINFLKLRVSAGKLGNDNVRPFEWKPSFEGNQTGAIFGTGSGVLSNAIIARNQGLYVPTRTWSKTNSYNVGMDLSTFGQKLTLTTEYYYQYIYDGFLSRSNSPLELGTVKPPQENYKISYSEGFELSLGYKDKIGRDFEYGFNGVFSRRHSRPIRLYQNPAVIGKWLDETLNDDSNQPGYVALGIIRTDEDVEKVKAMYPDINGRPIEKGMIYYKDISGPNYDGIPDGILDGNDRKIIAEYTTPPYSYGMSFNFGYKGFKLSGTFDGVFGHKVFVEKDEMALPTLTSNVFSWWGDYWSEDNPNASMPRPYNYGLENQVSTFWMRNGHTLRLVNLSLSYQVPKTATEKFKLPNVRFYSTVTNVWTLISPFDYKDPAVSRAYDYPLVRSFNFGLSISI